MTTQLIAIGIALVISSVLVAKLDADMRKQHIEMQFGKTRLKPHAWVRAAAGHVPSILYVEEHCRRDVDVLENAYMRMRPLVYPHPDVAQMNANRQEIRIERLACPNCGELALFKDGIRVMVSKSVQRLRCSKCGTSCQKNIIKEKRK